MTNSMIPYTFVPGTKAKAGEVNANFLSLANIIEQNINSSTNSFQDIYGILNQKRNIAPTTVTAANTDIDDYTTAGNYIFNSLVIPQNMPSGTSGTLVVTGDENSTKQIWICDDENPEIFTRTFDGTEWSSWYSVFGAKHMDNPGYLILPNGLTIQWGYHTPLVVTYPLSYTTVPCVVVTKQGMNNKKTYADQGFADSTVTGFDYRTASDIYNINWIVIGY